MHSVEIAVETVGLERFVEGYETDAYVCDQERASANSIEMKCHQLERIQNLHSY